MNPWLKRIYSDRIPLDCPIRRGMLPNEFVVSFRINGTGYVTEAHRDFLTLLGDLNDEIGTAGQLWVRPRRSLPGGQYLIELPEETFTSGELLPIPQDLYRKGVEDRSK